MNPAEFPGARFYKADLHIHTPASRCWKGSKNPGELERIFERLKESGIEVVAVTDHNSAKSIDAIVKLGTRYGILVFPGVEVSTREGHVLALFDPTKSTRSIEDWLSRLGIPMSEQGSKDAIAKALEGEQLSITKVFNLIEREGGLALAPHPNTRGVGFLEVLKQKGQARQDAYNSPYLRGLEVGENREQILGFACGRVKGYEKKYGCVANSDAHSVDEIGGQFTYIKLGDPGIGALKQVFYDPAMRIRFADEWPPEPHAWIQGVEVHQGFFDKVPFAFHPDTNCIVGGKAVGKSLLIELLRFGLDLESPIHEINKESRAKLAASTCLGDGGTVTIHLFGMDNERYRVQRTMSELDAGPEVYYADTQTKAAKDVREICPCKLYSQNEIIELGKNLPALLDWLDGFIDLGSDRENNERLAARMKTLLRALDAQHAIAIRRDALRKRIDDLKQKQLLLEEKVKDPVLKSFPKWQQEERQLKGMQEGLTKIQEEVIAPFKSVEIKDYMPEPTEKGPNHQTILVECKHLIGLQTDIQNVVKQLEAAVKEKQRHLTEFQTKWKEDFDKITTKHAALMKEAGVKNASAMLSELDKTTEAIEAAGRSLVKAEAAHKKKSELEKELRLTLMPAFNEGHSAIFRKRLEKAEAITRGLDYFVRITVLQMADRTDFEAAITDLARGSGLKGPTLREIAAKVTPLQLAEVIADKDVTKLCGLTGLKPEQVGHLIEHVWAQCTAEDGIQKLSDIYGVVFTELKDSIVVQLRVDENSYKPMEQLSVGSKCTAILSVALVEGSCPLIVDQPEDALDNPFVFERIVRAVRKTKQGRQYLFATHNSNIAVASDADLIYCLNATATEGHIDRHGSIDQVSTRDRVMANLEGGRDAFRLRSQKYDFVDDNPTAVVLDAPTPGNVGTV